MLTARQTNHHEANGFVTELVFVGGGATIISSHYHTQTDIPIQCFVEQPL